MDWIKSYQFWPNVSSCMANSIQMTQRFTGLSLYTYWFVLLSYFCKHLYPGLWSYLVITPVKCVVVLKSIYCRTRMALSRAHTSSVSQDEWHLGLHNQKATRRSPTNVLVSQHYWPILAYHRYIGVAVYVFWYEKIWKLYSVLGVMCHYQISSELYSFKAQCHFRN